MDKETIAQNEVGYVKMYKNTKGYNWDIKIFEDTDEVKFEKLILQLKALDLTMQETFGGFDGS